MSVLNKEDIKILCIMLIATFLCVGALYIKSEKTENPYMLESTKYTEKEIMSWGFKK